MVTVFDRLRLALFLQRRVVAGWLIICLAGLFGLPRSSPAAEPDIPPELKQSVDKAIAQAVVWLKQQPFPYGKGEGSLIAYALLKTKVSPDSPIIVQHRDAVLARIEQGFYDPTDVAAISIINYEAGCDAMFLESLDPDAYRDQLTIIRDFLIAKQLESGGWYYTQVPPNTLGDTSITQYAMLGLWAIHRSGLDVPRDVWARCAKYFISTQRIGGGFSYHPSETRDPGPSSSTPSMTAAGYGTALLTQLLLFGPDATPAVAAAPTLERKRFGVLQQLPDPEEEAKKAAARRPTGNASVGREAYKKMLPAAEQALSQFFEDGMRGPHPIYFLYGCERAGAISGNPQIGEINWYEKGADFLVKRQERDGRWDLAANYSAEADTSFAILFLSRATATLVPRPRKRMVAGGLLVGGRGLPDELDTVSVTAGEIKPHVPKGDVDQLLTALEQPTEVNLPEVTQAIVESVSLDNPEGLVGQLPRLRQLIRHPDAEVRQVAIWALARSGDFREAPRLIESLDDPDLYVAWEASMGLCVLSRLPLGINSPGGSSPLPIAPPGVQDENPDPNAAATWRKNLRIAWDVWYQRARPYDERENRRQIRPK